MVLHDLNLSARYADHLVAMRDGAILAEGAPADVVTEEIVRDGVRTRQPGDHRPGLRHAAGRSRRPPPPTRRRSST